MEGSLEGMAEARGGGGHGVSRESPSRGTYFEAPVESVNGGRASRAARSAGVRLRPRRRR